MKAVKNEIISSCCAIGGDGTEEVHVLEADCPIKREEGKREVEPFFKHEEKRTECTCIYLAGTRGLVIKPCQHYQGIKQVQRNKEKVWKVFCAAKDSQ